MRFITVVTRPLSLPLLPNTPMSCATGNNNKPNDLASIPETELEAEHFDVNCLPGVPSSRPPTPTTKEEQEELITLFELLLREKEEEEERDAIRKELTYTHSSDLLVYTSLESPTLFDNIERWYYNGGSTSNIFMLLHMSFNVERVPLDLREKTLKTMLRSLRQSTPIGWRKAKVELPVTTYDDHSSSLLLLEATSYSHEKGKRVGLHVIKEAMRPINKSVHCTLEVYINQLGALLSNSCYFQQIDYCIAQTSIFMFDPIAYDDESTWDGKQDEVLQLDSDKTD
jgi:hypothetical protein